VDVIAHFAEATKPELRPLPDAATRLLGDLVARRRQIIEMIGAERQREKRITIPRLRKSIARLIKVLEKELGRVDADIDDAVRGSPVWREKEDLLASVPGIGRVIARTLIAELPELGLCDRKEIAALAGLAPFTRESGQWRGRSFIGGGRAAVRSALFMGAMVPTAYRQRPARRPQNHDRGFGTQAADRAVALRDHRRGAGRRQAAARDVSDRIATA